MFSDYLRGKITADQLMGEVSALWCENLSDEEIAGRLGMTQDEFEWMMRDRDWLKKTRVKRAHGHECAKAKVAS